MASKFTPTAGTKMILCQGLTNILLLCLSISNFDPAQATTRQRVRTRHHFPAASGPAEASKLWLLHVRATGASSPKLYNDSDMRPAGARRLRHH
jgi:hypothetical protein